MKIYRTLYNDKRSCSPSRPRFNRFEQAVIKCSLENNDCLNCPAKLEEACIELWDMNVEEKHKEDLQGKQKLISHRRWLYG